MPTINEWLKQNRLPRPEARMLLTAATGFSAVQLLTHDQEELSEYVQVALAQMVARRLLGEPMAYILGEREFYGRSFVVNPSVLIPRPETEHLVEAVLAHLPEGGRVWDLGTGSGAVAVTVALERPDAAVSASDISEQALQMAQQNAEKLCARVEFAQGSWFHALRPSEKNSFDIIVSNPPYIEAGDAHLQQGDLRFEPTGALTDFSDGLSCLRELATDAGSHLKNGGWLMVEHGYDQGEAVRRLFDQNGFSAVQTLPDLAGLDRVTIGQHID